MALFEMVFGRKRIFLYRLASRASMSFLFHNPATYMGVQMYISRDLARQQVSCCTTSGSAFFSLHLRVFKFL